MASSRTTRRLTFILWLAAAVAGLYVYMEYPSLFFVRKDDEPRGKATGTTERECLDAGGTWANEHFECENAPASWCEEREGLYDGCASACRHDRSMTGEALPCSTECVTVCRLGPAAELKPAAGPENLTYEIDGSVVTLRDGKAGDGLRVETRIWGRTVETDIDGDGDVDHLMIIVRDYDVEKDLKYFVAAALAGDDGYLATNTVFIGDRIALEPVEFIDGEVRVNYTERLPWQDMSTRTSVGKTKRMVVDGDMLVNIVRPELDEDTARRLVVAEWGDCVPEATCNELRVRVIDDGDGVWYVEAVHDGLLDDSVRASKRIASVHHTDEGWVLGATLLEAQQCHEGRGHQGFLDAPCI